MLLSTRTTVSFALFLPQSDWLEWATLRMRNIVCFHVSRSCCCCCGRLINKLDPLHTYNLTWSCCLECDKFGLMILSLLLLATPPTHTHTDALTASSCGGGSPRRSIAFGPALFISFSFSFDGTVSFSFSFSFSFPFCFWLLPARSSVKQRTHTLAYTHASGAQRCQLFEKAMLKYQKALENK